MAEQSTEKLRIRLHVYDTDMPVNIRPEDEPLYRDAASLITKNDKEILYMALIEIALRYEMEKSRNNTEPYQDLLTKLTSEIEEVLGV